MNQHATSKLRRILFLTVAILIVLSSVTRARPALAQSTPADFDAVDEYISMKMEELGIPGAALVIVEGDQIVPLKAFAVADACIASNPDKKAADWWTTERC